jgi:hypothetical protein
MSLLFNVQLDHAKETSLTLEYTEVKHGMGFKLIQLSPGEVLREYHRRAQEALTGEPKRAIEASSYETVETFVKLLKAGDLQLEPTRSNILSIPAGLTVEIGVSNRNYAFLRADIYLRDPLINGGYIWKDRIAALETILIP